ncbi:MAG: threonylcarbamoyl-AMP synthase [Nitrospirae bacterium]|nr:threonylcarbamoyl-AMP synthase [Nitrospirota bacterium]
MERLVLLENNIEFILKRAVVSLEKGGIVAYPTETFYGLGVKFDIENSLKKLLEIKNRPKDKAMPLIIGNTGLLTLITHSLNHRAFILMERFWPGPLTLILPAREDISDYITAGTGKVAVRIPGKSFALHLAKKTNFPFTATSANPSGMPPARDAETVMKYFGKVIDLLIDGGHTPGDMPSTIVDVTEKEIKILRKGLINIDSIKRALDLKV